MIGTEAKPAGAVGCTDDEIALPEAECKHGVDGQGNEFSISTCGSLTEDIGVELDKFTSPAFLRFFVAETGANLEPFQWFGEITLIGANDTGQGCCEFRPKSDVTPSLIFKAKQLSGQLASGFFQIKLGGFNNGGLILSKTIAASNIPPN